MIDQRKRFIFVLRGVSKGNVDNSLRIVWVGNDEPCYSNEQLRIDTEEWSIGCFTYNGYQIYYHVLGQGDPVLLLHGRTSSA